MDESISILGLVGGIFPFYSNFKRNFCKQTVENLIRRRILFALFADKKDSRLIWVNCVKGYPFPSNIDWPYHVVCLKRLLHIFKTQHMATLTMETMTENCSSISFCIIDDPRTYTDGNAEDNCVNWEEGLNKFNVAYGASCFCLKILSSKQW